jgi:glycosyltransferase involved in cell wall biosynthesis
MHAAARVPPADRVPRVSLLLPCYNAALTLPDAIASIEQQTFRDYEVLAVDDGSTDATPALLHRWRERDRRVTLLSQAHAGIVAALTRALEAASGEIAARMDADDVAHPQRLTRQLQLLDNDSGLVACGTGVRYFPAEAVRDGARRYEQWLNTIQSSADVAREIFVECPIAHPTLCLRRTALDAVAGYADRGWPEDYDLVLRLFAAGLLLANVPEVLLDWREQPRRASRVEARYQPDAFRRCKVHYLRRTPLAEKNGVLVWGAGPVGKAFARELTAQGSVVRAFVELDARKIGQTIHGAPVVAPDRLACYRDALAVAAVGQPNARAEIRAALAAAGWREGVDFIAVA